MPELIYNDNSELTAITVNESDQPLIIWYCKAFLQDGLTVVINYKDKSGRAHEIRTNNIQSDNAGFSLRMNNAQGRSKAAGARCTLQVSKGRIDLIGKVIIEK
ncbi:hypothetical protein Ngar_c27900 [Candidatus Nitrososphaera gargensis Ga9.2]|uniref:Uncharacterized protein n=1 Tax=Nitrososphaera gargensis (strain Ga9.2) TaxID=1237085 RepID=K0IEF1_NITGG|nr:hypothetical protein [Candidatus Nitrososphaera gargensis]AFU59711.1 hypothetical protein Ngar_c27900 [Candidatus Nitrososphaera gargensis Ga9.2]